MEGGCSIKGFCLKEVGVPSSIFTIGLIFLVNMGSLQDNHDKCVFESFHHLSPLTCVSLAFPKRSFLNFGWLLNWVKDNTE